MMCTE